MSFKHKNILVFRVMQIISLPTLILLAVCFLNHFDAELGYFERGAVLPTVFWVLFFVGVAVALLSSLLIPSNTVIRCDGECRKIHKVALGLAGVVSVLYGCIVLLDVLPVSYDDTVAALFGIGTLAHGLYLLLAAAVDATRYRSLKLICLGFSTCFPVGLMLGNNSNYYYSINAADNVLCAVFGICFLLYILYEGKFAYGGECSRMRYAAMHAAVHVGVVVAFGYLIAYFGGGLTDFVKVAQMLFVGINALAVRIVMKHYIAVSDGKSAAEWQEFDAAAVAAAEAVAEANEQVGEVKEREQEEQEQEAEQEQEEQEICESAEGDDVEMAEEVGEN